MIKFIKYSLLSLLTMLPSFTSAHVKWFVDTESVLTKYAGIENTFFQWNSNEVLIWSLVTLCTVLLFGFIDKKVHEPKRLLKYGHLHENKINHIARIIFGMYLVSITVLWGLIISPDLMVSNTFTTILQYIQGLLGLAFIFNIKTRWASVATMVMFLVVAVQSSLIFSLENLMVLALAFYFFVNYSPKDSWIFSKFYKHGIEIVRIATGITLITLAFTEKFLNPGLSLEFLNIHNWNFMELIFPAFTNELFVLSVGFAETIFGILFIMGYLTRTTTILIAVFFAVSVSAMLHGFGLWEVEDLVVYSAAILFLFFGHGRTKFFHFN